MNAADGMVSFQEQITARIREIESNLCVGLDPSPDAVPAFLHSRPDPQLAWNQLIIDVTHDLACCYKPNLAFYLARGEEGLRTLRETIHYANGHQVPVILDAKFGDIGYTAQYYAQAAFEMLNAGAVTLNPYLGEETLVPFRDRTSFVLCLTSNMSRIDFQTRSVLRGELPEAPLFETVAQKVVEWNTEQNLGLVAGATAPEELERIREIAGPSIPILCPGVGVQGGDLEEALWAGYTGEGSLIINVSRAIGRASEGPDLGELARQEAAMFVNQYRTFLAQYREAR